MRRAWINKLEQLLREPTNLKLADGSVGAGSGENPVAVAEEAAIVVQPLQDKPVGSEDNN